MNFLEDFKTRVLPTKDKLFRFALRMLGNVEEAEDVVQEVFIKVWNKRKEMHTYQNMEAWCMKLTKNASLDKLKSRAYKVQKEKVDTTIVAKTFTPEKETEIKDTFQHIQRLMESLPEKQKLVMQLRDVEGYSYNEIADILEIPMSQVKVYLHRARTAMRAKLLQNKNYGF